MRENLIAFISAVAALQDGGEGFDADHPDGGGPNRRQQFRLTSGNAQLWFGHGYFERGGVNLLTPGGPAGGEQLSVAEGVDKFLSATHLDR